MTCKDCKNKENCKYPVLEDWECDFVFPPCRFLSQSHIDSINSHNEEVLKDYEF